VASGEGQGAGGGETTPGEPIGAFASLVARTEGLQPLRRVLHAGTGVVLAWAPVELGLGRWATVVLLAVVLAVLAAVDAARLRVPALNAFFFRAVPSLASPREAARSASSTWYVLGALLCWLLFPAEVAVDAILVLALADPAASVVGRLYGRRRVGKGSLEGGAAFFAVAAAVLFLAGFGWAAVPVALLVAAVEVTPQPADDNLVVPLAAGAFLVAARLLTGA
jgi:dolichol kinase